MSRAKAPRAKAAVAPVAVSSWRFYLVAFALAALLVLLAGRVLSLQVMDVQYGRDFLQNQGAKRALRTAELPAYRGVITDRRGEPLAVSTPVVSIWANPRELRESDRLPELAKALGWSEVALQERLTKYANKQFMYLKRHQEPPAARVVLAEKFAGVYGEREYQRFYPAGEVAAQVVGFTDVDGVGIDGVEFAYNSWLEGTPGRKQYLKDLHGEMVRDIGVLEPVQPGKDLALSIDLRLQTLQHRELQRAVTSLGAKSGSAVTLDSRTGEVLAMVNYPVYNPNKRRGVKANSMRNRAITDVYEPGSIVKALTLVAALESGKYSPNTIIDTSPGTIRVESKVYLDPSDYGKMSLAGVLQKSSQVGITKIALDLGHEPIWGVFNRFGIGEPPGTGFPGESAGKLPNRARWHMTEKMSLAFGYGITASALQLASAYSVFASGGVRQPISMVSLEGELPAGEQIISVRTAAQMLDMLHSVTEEGGTANKARIAGYEVGGKTGTVHKVGGGKYLHDKYVALFAGIAPIENPRIVTVVVIDEPKGDSYGGGAAAAPVFSAITQGALRILNIAPTRFEESEDVLLAQVDGGLQ
ncbi:MAG: peptidoglycan D,D-transpeptidase FtsI family protein [Halioglobus sp.]